jgi:hypothetical protein
LVVGNFNRMSGMGVESNHVSKHPCGLVEWTITIIVTVSVLLKEVILDDLGNF